MPTTENDRRNQQEPVLEKPSLPDHDRKTDPGMHEAHPSEEITVESTVKSFEESESAPPDQEFSQLLSSGYASNQARIPDDPNNWLTSDSEKLNPDQDPENRGDSLPDILEGTQH